MNRFRALEISFLSFFIAFLTLNSCRKFDNGQEVPAYIKLDKIDLVTDYNVQGAASSKIVDAWVHVDNEFIGVFELPAKIPVLKSGNHSIRIRPGILLNGNSDTRCSNATYAYYEGKIDLKEGKETPLDVKLSYAKFTDIEFKDSYDLDGPGLQVKTDPELFNLSNEGITKENYAEPSIVNIDQANVSPLDKRSTGVMHVTLDDKKRIMCIRPVKEFDFFKNGSYNQDQECYLEIESRSDVNIALYMAAFNSDGRSVLDEYAFIKSKKDWSKLYFHLTPFISRNFKTAKKITFFLIGYNPAEEKNGEKVYTKKEIFIDNIKLVHT
ncbi:MAG: hypothetical protein ACEPOW_05470 [Bacteroidales bacterium]